MARLRVPQKLHFERFHCVVTQRHGERVHCGHGFVTSFLQVLEIVPGDNTELIGITIVLRIGMIDLFRMGSLRKPPVKIR
jgi:hypothetical protein